MIEVVKGDLDKLAEAVGNILAAQSILWKRQRFVKAKKRVQEN